jgi:hypothetical protein
MRRIIILLQDACTGGESASYCKNSIAYLFDFQIDESPSLIENLKD